MLAHRGLTHGRLWHDAPVGHSGRLGAVRLRLRSREWCFGVWSARIVRLRVHAEAEQVVLLLAMRDWSHFRTTTARVSDQRIGKARGTTIRVGAAEIGFLNSSPGGQLPFTGAW